MSFEVLPTELLVKIFSHFQWKQRRDLSLVNRRWYQVIGSTNKVALQLSRYVCHRQQQQQQGTKYFDDVCIPLEILRFSSREYRNFSCCLRSEDSQFVSSAFGLALEYCHRRWNVQGLRIFPNYSQFAIFLQHYRHLLNDVVHVAIKLIDVPPKDVHFKGEIPNDTHLLFPMKQLETLNIQYGPRNLNRQSPICFVSLSTPKLECLNVRLTTNQTNVQLSFHDSTNIRSVHFCSTLSVHSTSVPEHAELASILPQASETTTLKIENVSIGNSLSAMFGNPQAITLSCVFLTPSDDPLECSNLTRLELRTIVMRKPLKLRVPQLRTLICDSRVLQSLHLKDAFLADCLEINLNGWDITSSEHPVGLSNFRRLRLEPWIIQSCYDSSVGGVWLHLNEIRELHLQETFWKHHFIRLKEICKHFPLLNRLHLQGMVVPERLDFMPTSVQNVFIEDCSIQGSSIEFPPTVQSVKVQKLWTQLEGSSGAELCLLPPNRFRPLDCNVMSVQLNGEPVLRAVFSTRNCHQLDGGPSDHGWM